MERVNVEEVWEGDWRRCVRVNVEEVCEGECGGGVGR